MILLQIVVAVITFVSLATSVTWAAYAAWITSTIHHPEREEHPPWYARYGKWSHEAPGRAASALMRVLRRRPRVRAAELTGGAINIEYPMFTEHHLPAPADPVQLDAFASMAGLDLQTWQRQALDGLARAARDTPVQIYDTQVRITPAMAVELGLRSTTSAADPVPIPNVRFTTDLDVLGDAGHALAVEAGLDPDAQVVNDGMPLWFEAVGMSGYTWHYLEYQTDDAGLVVMADDGGDPHEPATVSRSVLVTAEQVDRYYEAITIREAARS